MNTKLPAKTKTTLIKQFNRAHGRFINSASASAPKMVKAINESRVMGILIKELLGRENVTENSLHDWLRTNPGKLTETQVPWLMNFVRVSNQMQGELRLFADAPRNVVKMTMQCAGLLPMEAAREVAQISRELTPSAHSCKLCSDLKVNLDRLFKHAAEWDDETRSAVRGNLNKLRAFLDELERRITGGRRP